jgi:hypothetical protein
VRVVPVARKVIMIEERRPDQRRLFRSGDYRNRGQNPKKLSLVRVPMKMFSVARKLSMIDKRRPDQSCLFGRGNFGIEDTTQ